MQTPYPDIPTPSYKVVSKINVADLSELVEEKKQKNVTANTEKEIQLKHGRTQIVNSYLRITTAEYITPHIANGLVHHSNLIILYTELIGTDEVNGTSHWGEMPFHNRDKLLNTPICDLDIFEEDLTHKVADRNKSIIQMIEDVVPDGYRVNSLYGGQPNNDWSHRRYEVTIRNGCIICNDPCCLVFCCFSKSCLYALWTTKHDEGDPCPTRCCCDCRCCCGP